MPPTVFQIPVHAAGALAIVPRPRGGDWLEDDIRLMATHGVGVLVSLLMADEQTDLGLELEAAVCAAQGIEFLALPVPDLGVPLDSSGFIEAARHLAGLVQKGAHVGVHCRQSVGRSGLLAVSIAVACGVELNTALQQVSAARGVPVPETPVQRGWLERHVGRLREGRRSDSRSSVSPD